MKSVVQEFTIPDESLELFLRKLKSDFKIDYSGYAGSFIKRRVEGFLSQHKIVDTDVLLLLCKQDSGWLDKLKKELSIHYTEMFRNPSFFSAVRQKVLPFLSTYPSINIWHAGCSSGEEVYSLAILLSEVNLLHRCNIYASDKNAEILNKAASAIFDTSRMQEFTNNYHHAGGKSEFSNYYSSAYGKLKFQDSLRRSVTFLQHDLIEDKVIQSFNLILCRNVLIYFNPEQQDKVISLLGRSLSNLGYLCLGAAETLAHSKFQHEYAVIDRIERVYRRVSLNEWRNCKN